MYFVPSRNEARAALAQEAEEKKRATFGNEKRQLGDPIESWLSDLFGGENDVPTSTTRRTTSTTARTTVGLPTTPVIINTPTQRTTSTIPSTTSTRPVSTAQVITTPRPIVNPSPVPDVVTLTSTASNTANTGLTDASQSNTSSKSGLPSVVVGIIVAASVIFGLIFIALIARKIFQARRRNRRTTWARTSIIAPFEAPGIKEKALPPPPPSQLLQQQNEAQYPTYPAYPPAAMTYAQQPAPYSPAAASSAGYPAPYPFGGTGNNNNTSNLNNVSSANPFNASSYTPADLAGAPPVVIQQPPTPLTAVPPTATAAAFASNTKVSIVKRTFVPSLPDELSISNGDQVRVISAYDDGWALCEKVGSNERGVVPQECLEDVSGLNANTNAPASQSGSSESGRLNRASSLKRDQGTY